MFLLQHEFVLILRIKYFLLQCPLLEDFGTKTTNQWGGGGLVEEGHTVMNPSYIILSRLGTAIGRKDSATLQSRQWIINAAYNQRIIQSTPLYTA
jgi:hypothetical protein